MRQITAVFILLILLLTAGCISVPDEESFREMESRATAEISEEDSDAEVFEVVAAIDLLEILLIGKRSAKILTAMKTPGPTVFPKAPSAVKQRLQVESRRHRSKHSGETEAGLIRKPDTNEDGTGSRERL